MPQIMKIKFSKMHGLGNDSVVLDASNINTVQVWEIPVIDPANRQGIVRILITVIEVEPESARVKLSCEGFVNGVMIMDGVAVVRVPRRRKPSQR